MNTATFWSDELLVVKGRSPPLIPLSSSDERVVIVLLNSLEFLSAPPHPQALPSSSEIFLVRAGDFDKKGGDTCEERVSSFYFEPKPGAVHD